MSDCKFLELGVGDGVSENSEWQVLVVESLADNGDECVVKW